MNYQIATKEEKEILDGGETIINEAVGQKRDPLDVTWKITPDKDSSNKTVMNVEIIYKNTEDLTVEEVEKLEHDTGVKCTQREIMIQEAQHQEKTYEEFLRDTLRNDFEVDDSILTTIEQLENKIEEVYAEEGHPFNFDEIINRSAEAKQRANELGYTYNELLLVAATEVNIDGLGWEFDYESKSFRTNYPGTYNLNVGDILSKDIKVERILFFEGSKRWGSNR